MMTVLLVTLLDGSQINLSVPSQRKLIFLTPYAELHIPVSHLRECALGVHVDNPERFETYCRELGDDRYGQRDIAMKFLRENQRDAYKYLNKLRDSENPEVKRRLELLLKEYKTFPVIHDQITIATGNIQGEIKDILLPGENAALGKLSIRVSQIAKIATGLPKQKLTIVAANDWTEIGYIYNGRVKIAASGEVDLWPQVPGGYIARPDGYSTLFNGYPSGALLGRVGNKVFLVGASLQTNNMDRGKLELRINGSPWGTTTTPSGSFDVTVE